MRNRSKSTDSVSHLPSKDSEKNLNQPAILKSKEDSNHSPVYVKCHPASTAESGKIETIQEPMAEAFHQANCAIQRPLDAVIPTISQCKE
jgi:hypothetical protein